MHKMFPTWIESLLATAEADKPQVVAWHDAAVDFVTAADALDTANLVLLAAGHGDDEFETRWREHMYAADDLFPLKKGGRKVKTLAAAAALIASETDARKPVALAARRCVTAQGWQPVIDDLNLSAEDFSEAADELRVIPAWPRTRDLQVSTTNALAAIAAAENAGTGMNWETLKQVVNDMSQAAAGSIAKSESRIRESIERRELPLLEQSEVLIWLLSGQSVQLGAPWSEVSPLDAAVAAAVELDSLSRFSLGRGDAASLIAFKVNSAKKGAKPSNLDAIVSGVALPEPTRSLTPVLADVSAHVEEDPCALGLRLHNELTLARLIADED